MSKDIIKDYLENSKPQKRNCRICDVEFTGYRIICENKNCFYSLEMLRNHNRISGLFDYVPTSKQTFLLNKLPDGYQSI